MFSSGGAQMGFGLGALGAGLGAMFGGDSNPADAASPYYNQIAPTIRSAYQPYIGAGQQAMGQAQGQYNNLLGNYSGIQGQYNQLMNNPNGFLHQLGSGYQQSPGYQWQLNQAMQGANNAAAAGGMLGSPQHQQQAATMAQGLANQDYYNYMNQALGAYGTGLEGNAGLYGAGLSGIQGLMGQGFNASNQMGTDLANALMSQGNLAYSGQANQNQAEGSMWGNLGAGAGMLLGAFL